MGEPLPRRATGAPARVTVVGSTLIASKLDELRIATGTSPADLRLITLFGPPGLMSIKTLRNGLNAWFKSNRTTPPGANAPPPTAYKTSSTTPAPTPERAAGMGVAVDQLFVAGS